MLMTAEREDLIEQIAQLPAQLRALVEPLSASQLTTAYLAGEWTVAQNVHHLADSHMNSYIRCKLIATEQDPPLKPYKQEAWADLADASSADVALSLDLLTSLHARWAIFWRNLPPEAWSRTGIHAVNGSVTLDQQLRLYAEHGQAHLEQISRTLAAEVSPN